MPLTLTCTADTRVPIEVEGLTPDAVRDLSRGEIERFEVHWGNERLALAELFDVVGSGADGRIDFDGRLDPVHWIGAHMETGQVHVHGNTGRHIGSEMRGGQIEVHGNAGDWVGGEMHGGRIHVHGDAGHLVGAAYRGSRLGMTGGTILIDGDAGGEVGHTMRRGWIVVGGEVGDMLAFNMRAGSIFALGPCGIRPGAGMRRGTVALLGTAPTLLPTFRYACTYRPQVMALMLRQLRDAAFDFDQSLLETEFDLFHGDMLEQGRGEILVAHGTV
jgi:formylmethanofuran dehydrogenase subunit C